MIGRPVKRKCRRDLFTFCSARLEQSVLVGSKAQLNQLGDLGERCKLPQWIPGSMLPGQSPCQKRIWCTLELSESHWWQSFRVFWSACFTVDRSNFITNWRDHYYMEWNSRLSLSWWAVLTHPSLPLRVHPCACEWHPMMEILHDSLVNDRCCTLCR